MMGTAAMKLTVEWAGECFRVDVTRPVELAVPLDFYGPQPRAFGMPRARAEAVEGGDFVGDRRRGGSVNCEVVEFIAHGNATHTEGVGHITKERISVGEIRLKPLLPAGLLTVPCRALGTTSETYDGLSDDQDQVICAADLQEARTAAGLGERFLQALVIRAKSDELGRTLGDHSGTNPPYFTTEAMRWLREVSCDHLLVELPSVDREVDGGTVPNHHLFFGIRPDETPSEESRARTITEMIRLPEELADSGFALDLQVPRFIMDAAPSRPILYPLERIQ